MERMPRWADVILTPLISLALAFAISALVILAIGVDPTRALVLSQVVLSMGIPFALIPLVWLTSRADVVGEHVNSPRTKVAAVVVTTLIVALNGVLLALVATGAG